jgi:hypothetical protein
MRVLPAENWKYSATPAATAISAPNFQGRSRRCESDDAWSSELSDGNSGEVDSGSLPSSLTCGAGASLVGLATTSARSEGTDSASTVGGEISRDFALGTASGFEGARTATGNTSGARRDSLGASLGFGGDFATPRGANRG